MLLRMLFLIAVEFISFPKVIFGKDLADVFSAIQCVPNKGCLKCPDPAQFLQCLGDATDEGENNRTASRPQISNRMVLREVETFRRSYCGDMTLNVVYANSNLCSTLSAIQESIKVNVAAIGSSFLDLVPNDPAAGISIDSATEFIQNPLKSMLGLPGICLADESLGRAVPLACMPQNVIAELMPRATRHVGAP